MGYDLKDKLVIGISSTALFDLVEEDVIFKNDGLEAYCRRQIDLEDTPLKKGTAFKLIRDILRINDLLREKRKAFNKISLVEVILMSKNSPDTSLRIFKSLETHDLTITRAALTGGRSLVPYLKAFNVSLFLSTDEKDVQEAYKENIPSALVYSKPQDTSEEDSKELVIAFDGDAVLFSEESEKIYKEQGLEAFLEHEKNNAKIAMDKGPFFPFFNAISLIQTYLGDQNIIRTVLVTARNTPAHERVIRTLREWNVRIDQAFFLGGIEKSDIIKAICPHFFFDDQDVHLKDTFSHTAVGKVPSNLS